MKKTRENKIISRKAASRCAMMVSQCNALLEHKRIITTLAKAKAQVSFIEPVITKARARARTDRHHAYRYAFAALRSKQGVTHLFDEVLPKMDRDSGYTRVIKLGPRKGDAADMALIELVDFSPLQGKMGGAKQRKGVTSSQTAGKRSQEETPNKAESPKQEKQ